MPRRICLGPEAGRGLLLFGLSLLMHGSFAQRTDSTKAAGYFAGTISVTNNGLSFIPTFSLGDPAALFLLSVGKERISFDPEFRFSLEGKPWTFIFWGRYRILTTGKFRLQVGPQLGMNFRTLPFEVNGLYNTWQLSTGKTCNRATRLRFPVVVTLPLCAVSAPV